MQHGGDLELPGEQTVTVENTKIWVNKFQMMTFLQHVLKHVSLEVSQVPLSSE